MKYIRQLDSVRGIALLMVIAWHWVPHQVLFNLNVGAIALNTFFVLSGFLITRILMENKNAAEQTGTSKIQVFKKFYIRRTLRIFPIYYLFIFLLFGAHIIPVKEFLHLVSYTDNFYFIHTTTWTRYTAHLWSLSVEEQFYLLWPWVTLLMPKKYLLSTILAFIGLGIISQLIYGNDGFAYIITSTCFDAFGLGALLSWFVVYRPQLLPRFYKAMNRTGVLSLILLAASFAQERLGFLHGRTVQSLLGLWIITYVVYKQEQLEKRPYFILNLKPFAFLGKISYGIYLLHLLMPAIIIRVLDRFIYPHFPALAAAHLVLLYTLSFSLLIGTAWLSWTFFEQPVLRLKKHVNYQYRRNTAIPEMQLHPAMAEERMIDD